MSDPTREAMAAANGGNWRPWHLRELPAAVPARRNGGTNGKARADKAANELAEHQQRELDAIREAARKEGYQSGYDAGFAAARDEGLAAGREQAGHEAQQQAEATIARELEQTVAPLAPLADSLQGEIRSIIDDIPEALVELAITIGEQLARDTVRSRPTTVLKLVRELLEEELGNGADTVLYMHSRDLALVQRNMGQDLATRGWTLQADDRITRGGCTLTRGEGSLDATWETRCAALQSRRRQRSDKTPGPSESPADATADSAEPVTAESAS